MNSSEGCGRSFSPSGTVRFGAMLIALFLAGTACRTVSPPQQEGNACDGYFPNMAFSSSQATHDHLSHVFGIHLFSMDEPSFQRMVRENESRRHDDSASTVSLRILTIAADGYATMLRLDMSTNWGKYFFASVNAMTPPFEIRDSVLWVKQTRCHTSRAGEHVVTDETIAVSSAQAAHILQLVQDMDLKAIPARRPEAMGLLQPVGEVEVWLLEVVIEDRYFLLTREMPGEWDMEGCHVLISV